MGSLNHCQFIGHLGRDAELRYTAGGEAVATLNLACSESWKDRTGEKRERTEWVRVILWGKVASALAEYLTKGKQIYIAGRMETRKWTDKSGETRYTTEIKGDRVVLLGGGERRQETGSGTRHVSDEEIGRGEPVAAGGASDFDDDIPFAWLLPILLPVALGVHALIGVLA